MGRLRSVALALSIVCLAAGAVPAPARAESVAWTLVASPLVATTGTETTFTLTATNADALANLISANEIGCVVLDVPNNFTVAAAKVTDSNAGGSWGASLSNNRVRVQAGSGGDRLAFLQWVRFTVRATPKAAGSLAWTSRAYRDQDCGGSGALLTVPPIVVVSGPPVTPTPQPTATPTPTPTPTPRPSILPTLRPTPLPTLLPTLPPVVLPTPRPTVQPSDRPSASPTPNGPTASPAPTDPAGSPAGSAPPTTESSVAIPSAAPSDGGGGPPAAGPGSGSAGTPPRGEPRLRIDADLLFGVSFEWVVPAAVVGVPGLLVILVWLAAQTGAALIWIPAVRRFREERQRRGRLPVTSAGAGTP